MEDQSGIGTNEGGRDGCRRYQAEPAEHLVSLDVNLFIAENIKPGRIPRMASRASQFPPKVAASACYKQLPPVQNVL
jgi:hypothetical protein